MNNDTFGERLKNLRIERDLLKSEFGEIIGARLGTKRISPSAVGSYERNEREPAYFLLREFADFFGVSIDYLLCHSNERTTVEEYIRADKIEFSKALDDLSLTMDGREITKSEKQRIYDISLALLWRD